MSNKLEPTPSNTFGPYYVVDAPFRGKLSPIYEYGKALLIKGTVRNTDGESLAFVNLDIWQAGMDAKYDYVEKEGTNIIESELNEGSSKHFDYRMRLISNEDGAYEFETLKPLPYIDERTNKLDKDVIYRSPHIHFFVRSEGYKPLVTQLFFKGEEKNNEDKLYNEKCAIELEEKEVNHTSFFVGTFDIVLEKAVVEEEKNVVIEEKKEDVKKSEVKKDNEKKDKKNKHFVIYDKDKKKGKGKKGDKEKKKEKKSKSKDEKEKKPKSKGDKKEKGKKNKKDEKKEKEKKKEDKEKEKKEEKEKKKQEKEEKKKEKKENEEEKKEKKEDKKKEKKDKKDEKSKKRKKGDVVIIDPTSKDDADSEKKDIDEKPSKKKSSKKDKEKSKKSKKSKK